MVVIDDALRDLVSRIEQEFETRGAVTPESARELHGLRVGAEQLLAAQIEADQ